MDTIPQDVWPLIASNFDDKTKRQMRLASTKWFHVIKYNNFNIYFAHPKDIPVITERLSKYSWPIKLGFVKSKFKDGLEIIDYLPKLTNLTHLSVDEMKIDPDDVELDQWMRLSTLSNLEVCAFLPDDMPRDLLYKFPKLTDWGLIAPEAELTPILKQMSNLEVLHCYSESTWPFALVPYPEKLTSIGMSTSNQPKYGNEMWSKLTNLKDLCLGHTTSATIDIKYAMALEKFYFEGETLPSLETNTNLTYLRTKTQKWTLKNAEDVAKLTKLQTLEFELPSQQKEPMEFNFVSNLKKLRKFHLHKYYQSYTYPKILAMDRIYDYLSHSLTSLTVDTDDNLDLARLVKMDLVELRVENSFINGQHLSTFSNLTSLSIRHYKEIDLESMSSCTNLKDLTLEIADFTGKCQCEFLYGLTKLTSLHLYSKFQIDSFWQNVVQLTKIQNLKIEDIDNDDRLLVLTAFKNLTSLRIEYASKEFSGIHFTALTSLQSIWFTHNGSKLAHKEADLKRTMPYLLYYSDHIPLF